MCNYVFIDGKYVLSRKAGISVKDRGFLYGDGLYETLRSYKGSVFMLDEHIDRLFRSLKILEYNIPFNEEYVRQSVIKTLARNNLEKKDSYIKIIVTRGIHKKDLYFSSSYRPCLIIIAEKLAPCPEKDYTEGINIISSKVRRPSIGSPIYTHKLINYFENLYAKNEAHSNGAGEAIFLTADHLVLEGASSNIFYVKRNTVYTPPITQNILPGVTRKVVIGLCRGNGIRIKERKIHYRDFIGADEIFKTSSVAGIVPVKKVDRFELDGQVLGPITRKIMELFESKVCKV
ncbi:MAG: aminotransferase class IV [Candidatus Humimicrobiaceae bacterium]|jgi:branched-chain amino acid aminotransferase|nr:aminotransferase class IV [Candidatus Humimicrobiaceae bacterium]